MLQRDDNRQINMQNFGKGFGTGVFGKCAVAILAMLITAQPAFANTNTETQYDDEHSIRDPWEGYNRPMFEVNQAVDSVVFKPAAQVYDSMPDVVRDRFTNFLNNLDDVPTFVNNILQGDISAAGNDLGRILINTTLGIVGLFDVAQYLELHKNDDDFGKTLGEWGVPTGPYFMIPLLGPSSARDAPAKVVDIAAHPTTYFASSFQLVVLILDGLETRANLLDKEEVIRTWSKDYYAAVRNYYLSRRGMQAGTADEETYEYDIDLKDVIEEIEVEKDKVSKAQ